MILLLQAGGMLFIFKCQQYSAYFQMQQDLFHGSAKLEQLTFSLEEYNKNRQDDGDEISFQDKLYDVKSVTVNGKTVTLLAVNDTKEESVMLRIRDFIREASLPGNEVPMQLLQLFSMQYISPQTRLCFFIPSVSIQFPDPKSPALTAGTGNIFIPPPEQATSFLF
ncbi:MAG: hypothetical protein JWO09_3514 [Bacteroidetes bacterium]|nr:hypothetical protein [Bacteroidota bacterium]